ncbi:MAG: hypothetical protein GJ680_17825 [Alteromonadaceae bacterium]|nr:hypothetical protein [Alteromonadaceae bacterium]
MTISRTISNKTQVIFHLAFMMLLTASVAVAGESQENQDETSYFETCLAPVESKFELSEINKTVVEDELSALLFSDDPMLRAAAKSLLVGLSVEKTATNEVVSL